MVQTPTLPRIHLITGHYGSGKTEFALNYALHLKTQHEHVALVDLDIVNVYFRSREYADMLQAKGIEVHGSAIKGNQVDIPALAAGIQAPLEDRRMQVVVDLGGNPVGARVLGYYRLLLEKERADHLFVINRHRPETQSLAQVSALMRDIAAAAHAPISALVNTTHMLKDTTVDDLIYGQALCREVAEKYDLPIRYIACRSDLKDAVAAAIEGTVFPMTIFMRMDWMK